MKTLCQSSNQYSYYWESERKQKMTCWFVRRRNYSSRFVFVVCCFSARIPNSFVLLSLFSDSIPNRRVGSRVKSLQQLASRISERSNHWNTFTPSYNQTVCEKHTQRDLRIHIKGFGKEIVVLVSSLIPSSVGWQPVGTSPQIYGFDE